MRTKILIGAASFAAVAALAADATSKDEVAAAAKRLQEQTNYSWKTTVAVPESSPFKPGPTEGKTEKRGYTQVMVRFGQGAARIVFKGDKTVVTDPQGAWLSLAELEANASVGSFMGMIVRNIKTPAVQAADLLAATGELKHGGDYYEGDFSEQGAKNLLKFRRAGEPPTASEASGAVKFWLKGGLLGKYEYHLKGKVTVDANVIDVDRTTTVEIKDIGATKLEIPEEARRKLS